MLYNFDKKITIPALDKKEFGKVAVHLSTKGAYVQNPIPGVYAIAEDEVLASVDAESLYPTEMCNGNIGYDSLYGRIYDTNIIGNTIQFIEMIFQQRQTKPDFVFTGYQTFKKNFLNLVQNYVSRNKPQNGGDLKKYSPDIYALYFYKIISYPGTFHNIMNPETDEEYILLKSCLYPILEALTWLHQENPGYNKTCVEYTFHYPMFKEKYKNQKFYIFDKINSTYTRLVCVGYDDLINYYFTKFIINPWGTLFYKHHDFKSFEVDNIFKGKASRRKIKNEYLILEAITEQWHNLSDPEKMSFYNTREHIDESFCNSIINLVGDKHSESTRKKQAASLIGIHFDLADTVDYQAELRGKEKMDVLFGILVDLSNASNSYQDGEKVSLNSGYGLFGMISWEWFQNLVSNSITCAGKIHGIKLFQQIAVNVLRNERQSRGLD